MSSVVGEDTAQTINEGRATLGAILRSGQKHLQKVFVTFVLGLVGTIYFLREPVPFLTETGLWAILRDQTTSRIGAEVGEQLSIITRSPFDVILVQVKIGLIVGVLLSLPLLLYLSRDALARRGYASKVPINGAWIAAFVVLAILLFLGGISYAYFVFFPFMFEFLAGNAVQSSIRPSYDIVLYIQFIAFLGLSFGLAAQLPLGMSALAYTEVVPYETFRDKWRYAVVAIFGVGAAFSPPDPFTQIMWAVPLVGLYVFSLGLAKLLTNLRRADASDPGTGLVRRAIVGLAGLFAATALVVGGGARLGGIEAINSGLLPLVPERVALGPFSTGVRPAPLSLSGLVGADGLAGQALLGTTSGLAVVAVTVFAYMLRVLNQPVHPRPGPGGAPDPESIDLGELDAAGVRSAPPEAFEALSEDEAVDLAGAAMDADDPEKAQAILDRFDEVDEAEGDGEAEADEDEENVLAGTAAGMADAFTEEETTEEDVGGYYYDVAFVLRSLTSKAFRIVGVFMGVLSVVFFWLYQGGLGQVKRQFLERVDREVLAEVLGVSVDQVDPASANFIVALHPVEQLVFEIKVATLLGAVAAAPVLMYYAWPAIKERGLGGGGSSGVFLVWGVTLLVGTVGGSLLGFFVVAPTVISFLVEDALAAQMVVSFRLKAFFWLVLFTTVGVGLLADVPLTMLLFDRGGIVSYETMAKRWRGVVLGVVAVIGFLTPQGALTMIVLSAPVVFAYAVGLGLLWLVTLPRRARGGGGAGEQPTAD